jgi:hypothetical protein
LVNAPDGVLEPATARDSDFMTVPAGVARSRARRGGRARKRPRARAPQTPAWPPGETLRGRLNTAPAGGVAPENVLMITPASVPAGVVEPETLNGVDPQTARQGRGIVLIVPVCVGVMPTMCSLVSASRGIYAVSAAALTASGLCVCSAAICVPVSSSSQRPN